VEREFITQLRERLPPHPLLKLGIGDDAAILSLGQGADVVVTTDLLADGTHFLSTEQDLARIGRKALAVNLSDLAAMAARPVGAVVAIALPKSGIGGRSPLEVATRLYDGLLPLAAEFNVPIAGGDTNTWNGPLVIAVTALGAVTPRGPLLRSGAKIGDSIYVTGTLGGSLAGKHLDFTPRVAEALELAKRHNLHAGMDITDGLAIDLDRLITASNCGAVLDLASIPLSAACGVTNALGDGEDFELLMTAAVPLGPLPCGITKIGEIIADRGLWSRDETGAVTRLPVTGYLHR